MKLIHKPLLVSFLFGASCALSNAAVLYTMAGSITVNDTWNYAPTGNMDVSRSATATGTLYFKYTLTNPGSYTTGAGSNADFYAGMSLFNGGGEGPGIGKAWGYGGYSSFGTLGNNDFKSANGQSGPGTWQPVSSTDMTTIVFRIDFNANANDNVTVWLNPDLNLTEAAQSASLTTSLSGDCTFDRFYLREGDAGSGWTYSNVAIAESFSEIAAVPEPAAALLGAFGLISLLRRRR